MELLDRSDLKDLTEATSSEFKLPLLSRFLRSGPGVPIPEKDARRSDGRSLLLEDFSKSASETDGLSSFFRALKVRRSCNAGGESKPSPFVFWTDALNRGMCSNEDVAVSGVGNFAMCGLEVALPGPRIFMKSRIAIGKWTGSTLVPSVTSFDMLSTSFALASSVDFALSFSSFSCTHASTSAKALATSLALALASSSAAFAAACSWACAQASMSVKTLATSAALAAASASATSFSSRSFANAHASTSARATASASSSVAIPSSALAFGSSVAAAKLFTTSVA
mmetsp:Transcript_136580/g.237099  ORF Transcript_136580/g.237099 Transcript_136580/m.237099 type:complete len:283 (+) Transcript_136580:385-1233(+)